MKKNYFLLGLSIVISSVNITLPIPSVNLILVIVLTIASTILVYIASLPLRYESDKPIKKERQSSKPKQISKDIKREFDKLCKHKILDITRKIKLQPTTSIISAESFFCTIRIGQTILDKFDLDLLKAVLAHELLHIKKNHYLKSSLIVLSPLICAISIICVLLFNFHWKIDLSYPFHFLVFCNIFIIAFALTIVSLRPVNWSKEYEADLIAARIVGNDVMIKCLREVANLRSQDMKRDLYKHPSILKRINNIEQNNKAPN
jgi:hypothetical protein